MKNNRSKPLRLAILAQAYLLDPTAPINGTFVQLYNLSLGFAKAGIEVHYVAATKDSGKPHYEVVNDIHFHWIHFESGLLEWYSSMKKYNHILESIQPDAVYVRGRNVLQYVAGKYAVKNKINYVWGTNGEDSAEFWKNLKRLKKANKSIAKKAVLFPLKALEDSYINKGMKMSTAIINQSEHQKKETKRLLNKEGEVLPSYFAIPEEQITKENIVLWLANLSPSKQPDLFIKLIKSCRLEDWKVVLGGGTTDKNYESQIKSLVENSPVSMKGQIKFKDSFKYYKRSRIYVNTSKPEADGLPNAYIQSWLNGTVVISLHHDPNGWMKTHDIGFCAHGNFEALKNKLQELINNSSLLQTMSNNATKFAKETFASQKIIDSYIKKFSKVPLGKG